MEMFKQLADLSVTHEMTAVCGATLGVAMCLSLIEKVADELSQDQPYAKELMKQIVIGMRDRCNRDLIEAANREFGFEFPPLGMPDEDEDEDEDDDHSDD